MPFQLSPGVITTERDLTTIIPSIATTAGVYSGAFQWGPVLDRVLVETEQVLVSQFGKPDNDTATSFFTASNFLSYGNNLNLVRVVGDEAVNASSYAEQVIETFDGDGLDVTFSTVATFSPFPSSANLRVIVDGVLQIEGGSNDYTFVDNAGVIDITFDVGSIPAIGVDNIVVEVFASQIDNEGDFEAQIDYAASVFGKYPGESANGLEVWAIDSVSWLTLTADEQNNFTGAPTGDEIHFMVLDALGVFTGVAGTVLEKYEYLSTVEGTLGDDGSVIYYKERINQSSRYIWSTGQIVDFVDGKATLAGARDDNTVTTGNRIAGYDLFINPNVVDVSLIMAGEADSTLISYLIQNIAEVRKDCVVFCSPQKIDVVNNPLDEVDDSITFRELLPSSSYGFMDNVWKYQFDRYNDIFRWIPANGSVAGTVVFTDRATDPWFSPGGFNRGQIKNVQKLAYNPSEAEMDRLYQKSINPIVAFTGEGTVLFGDKTMLAKPSAFDHINVRRLFIVLEKSIARAARYTLFEFNDEFTRAQFVALVQPFLEDVRGRRGIIDYKVICDETNNTGEVIDRNEFVGDIYIKPNKSINFIQLNFIAVRSNVNFNEIIGA